MDFEICVDFVVSIRLKSMCVNFEVSIEFARREF